MNGIRITTIVTIFAIALGLTAGGCETGASRGKLAKLKKDYPIECGADDGCQLDGQVLEAED